MGVKMGQDSKANQGREQSNGSVSLQVRNSVLMLEGDITFLTVNQVLTQGREAIKSLSADSAVLDLSAVTKADSAGLALVVDWARTAKQCETQLKIIGVSPHLADIARVSGLEDFLAGEQ